ncbi:MAG: putative type II secretion system protein E [Parcubacteria group bacterium Athens0714_24]|nr:MAG: putative type II secretion system protein E [Parcubacteria group bacterium Athens0714_24]
MSLEKLLLDEGISEKEILDAKGEAGEILTRTIVKDQISFEVLKQIPEEAARHYKFVPLEIKDGVLEVGMVNPENVEAREALQFIVSKLNIPFRIYLITDKDLEIVLDSYKGIRGEVGKVLNELESALAETIREESVEDFLKTEIKFIEDAPITKMVAVILKHAISGNASDIHIEPTSEKTKVRFRVDGILYTSIMLPISVHDAIVSRIKILTNLKIDEKRKPQDGRFETKLENRNIDFRVSTFPTFWGEKVVIRILDKVKGVRSLKEIGFSEDQLVITKEAIKRPYGMILITGPTGSGKTTTLYAMLQELDKEKYNVVSLEDPIEYNIEGVSQSQVLPEIGYDFANGLRSILRQDPDMIMVGEIRDKETAALAIQAALTGHLVFATLHTNNASGVIPRLVDMGVDPFLIAPTILLAIGQRLARTLCPDSKKEIPLLGAAREKIEKEIADIPENIRKNIKTPDRIYQGVPSATCPKGARGRIGIFEILRKSPELENIILNKPIDVEIMKEARRQGMYTMREQGLMKLFEGIISFEEFNKL